MNDFEIRRITEDSGPQFVNIYCRGVNLTPGELIPAFGGEAERMVEQFERVAQALNFNDSFRVGERCKLKDVDLIGATAAPGKEPQLYVKRGTEGTVMKITWASDKEGCKLTLEVDFDNGPFKRPHTPYVHRLDPKHLSRVASRHESKPPQSP
jgi:hypothetical protein